MKIPWFESDWAHQSILIFVNISSNHFLYVKFEKKLIKYKIHRLWERNILVNSFNGITKCKIICFFILLGFIIPAFAEALQNQHLIANYDTNSILFDEEQFAALPDLEYLGDYNNFLGTPVYAHIENDYLYVVSAYSAIPGFHYIVSKYNYSDKANMELIGSDTIPGWLSRFVILNDVLYINDRSKSLVIYNISNINDFQLTYESPLEESSSYIIIKDNFAYLGIYIFNVTDIYNPELSYVLPDVFVLNYYLVDDYLVGLGDWGDLRFYNITNPYDISLIVNNTIPVSYDREVNLYTAQEGFLAIEIGWRTNNISIFDTSDIENVTYVFNTGNISFFNNTNMFLFNGSGNYSIYNFEDIYNPVHLANFHWGYSPKFYAFTNDYCIILDWEKYIYSIDFSDLTNPVLIDSIDLGGKTLIVGLADDYAFTFVEKYNNYRLYISDISNLSQAHVVNEMFYENRVLKILQKDDYVYILGETSIQIVDISMPIPEFVGSYTDPIAGEYYDSDMVIHDHYIFVVSDNYGLTILDITYRTNPILVHNHPTIEGGIIQIQNDYLFIEHFSRHYIYRMNSMSDIELLYTIEDSEINFHGFGVSANTLYIHVIYNYNFTHTGRIQAYDITDKEHPIFIEEFTLENPYFPSQILYYEDHLYVPIYYKGILVFDSKEGPFTQVAKYNMTSEIRDSTIHNGILCIAKSFEGISLFSTIPGVVTTVDISIDAFMFYIPFMILIPLLKRKKQK